MPTANRQSPQPIREQLVYTPNAGNTLPLSLPSQCMLQQTLSASTSYLAPASKPRPLAPRNVQTVTQAQLGMLGMLTFNLHSLVNVIVTNIMPFKLML